jgi:hypothetical protein
MYIFIVKHDGEIMSAYGLRTFFPLHHMGRAFEETFLGTAALSATEHLPRPAAVDRSTQYPVHANHCRPAEQSVAMSMTRITSTVVRLRREWQTIVHKKTGDNWQLDAQKVAVQIIPEIVAIMENNQWTLAVQREIRCALGNSSCIYIGGAESIIRQRYERSEKRRIDAAS